MRTEDRGLSNGNRASREETRRPAACSADKGTLSTQLITFRLIRVVSPDGLVQISMTSLLNADLVPTEFFSDLYHMR